MGLRGRAGTRRLLATEVGAGVGALRSLAVLLGLLRSGFFGRMFPSVVGYSLGNGFRG